MTVFLERAPYIALALLLGWLTYLMYKQKWQKQFTVCLVLSFFSIMCAAGWFQGFFRTGVVTLLLNEVKGLGETLNKYNTTTEQVRKELIDTTAAVESQQAALTAAQHILDARLSNADDAQRIISEDQSKLAALADQLATAQGGIMDSQQSLSDQQKALVDPIELAKRVFGTTTTEMFSYGDTNRMSAIEMPGGKYLVFFNLSHIPIFNTVRIQYHIYAQPPPAHFQMGNSTIGFSWGDSFEKLKDKQFYVSYAIASLDTNSLSRFGTTEDGKIVIDGNVVPVTFN